MHPQFGSVASQCKSTNQPGPLHPMGDARNGGAKASVLPPLAAAARLFASAAGPHRADRRGLVPVMGSRVPAYFGGPNGIQSAARTRHSARKAVPQLVGAECEALLENAGSPVQPLSRHRD